jgi:phage terminase large subunit
LSLPIEARKEKGQVQIRFNLTPAQRLFLEMPTRYRLFVGGVGSGKTTAGCLEVIRVCLFYPGTQVLIARKTARELEKTTLQVFEELLVLLDESCKDFGFQFKLEWNNEEQKCRVKSLTSKDGFDYATVYWLGMDKPDKLQGMNLGAFFLDEGREIEEKFFEVLKSRLRNPRGPRRGWIASLPPPSGHWLDRLFLRGEGGEEYGVIHATTFDNPYLPQDFIDDIMQYDEWTYREFVLGEQVPTITGGPIFPNFSKKHHVLKDTKEKLETLRRVYGDRITVYRGIDFGFHFPAAVWVTLDEVGRLVVLREFLGTKMTFDEFLAKLKSIDAQEGWVVLSDFHDPHATYQTELGLVDRVSAMVDAGLKPVPASCKFEDGVHLIQKLLSTLIFKEPALQIFERCRLLILGFEGEYCWDKTGARPQNSVVVHLMDALRYAVMGLWGRLSQNMSLVRPTSKSRFGGFSYTEDFAR